MSPSAFNKAFSDINDESLIQKSFSDMKTNFTTFVPVKFNNAQLKQATLWTLSLLFPTSLPEFRVTTDVRSIERTIRWNANAGFPTLKRKDALRSTLPALLRRTCVEGFSEFLKQPVVVFNRIAPTDSGTLKRRHVYCPPFAITVLEVIFGIQVMEHFLRSDGCIKMGWTQQKISDHVSSRPNCYQLSIDFKTYDQTLPSYFILYAFDLIKGIYTFPPGMVELYDKMAEYVCFAHVYHPRTGVIRRKRGLISGSYFTNLVDGIINTLVITLGLIVTKQSSYVTGMSIHGDDNWISSKREIDLKLLNEFIRGFGMEISLEKCHTAKPSENKIHFLGSL